MWADVYAKCGVNSKNDWENIVKDFPQCVKANSHIVFKLTVSTHLEMEWNERIGRHPQDNLNIIIFILSICLSTCHPSSQMFVLVKTSPSGVKYRSNLGFQEVYSALFSGTTWSQTYISTHAAKRAHRLSLGPPPTHNPPGLLTCHCKQNERETMANVLLYSSPGFMAGVCLRLNRVRQIEWEVWNIQQRNVFLWRTHRKEKKKPSRLRSLRIQSKCCNGSRGRPCQINNETRLNDIIVRN